MTIYLDNMAATPVDPRVAARHAALMTELPGNANSAEHADGARAGAILQGATAVVAEHLGRSPPEITFTPGASSAIHLAFEDAIARADGRVARILASAAEHPATIACARRAEAAGRARVVLIPVDGEGSPLLEELRSELREGADLVCTMAANNEVGTVTEVAEAVALSRVAGAPVLVDGSQAVGKLPASALGDPDYLVVSGAKMYGPRRVGVIAGRIAPQTAETARVLLGSPDPAGAAALALALELRIEEMAADEARIGAMRDRMAAALVDAVPELRLNGSQERRVAGCLHVSTPHLPGDAVVSRLWNRVSLSTGAACQSGAPGPSPVLVVMGLPQWAQEGALRIGIGRFNTPDEIEEATALLAEALVSGGRARRRA